MSNGFFDTFIGSVMVLFSLFDFSKVQFGSRKSSVVVRCS